MRGLSRLEGPRFVFRTRQKRCRAGFSLLETLVAFAVFSLGALALINLTGENTRSAAHVETRVLAGIVADNRAVEALSLPFPPAYGDTEGQVELGRRGWTWRQSVSRTPDPGMVRIDVRVFDGPQQMAHLTVFRDTGG